MGHEQAKEPGALGQVGEQRPVVPAPASDQRRGCRRFEGMP